MAIAILTLPWVAFADDISNNLDSSVDAVAEVMTLTQSGAGGTTQLYVVPRNGDGKNGCNLTGSTTLVVSVSSSDTSVATVSPGSVTFTSCGDTPTLTVTPHNAGSATISVSQTSNTTGAAFNLAPATFTVVVAPPPNTPPQVSVAGVTGGASYSKGSVPAATCQVTDAEDGNSSFPATLSAISGPYASDGIGEQTASCSYTDTGGLTAVAAETYGIVDPSAPSIGYALNPAAPDGNNGWYRSNVSLTWNVDEPESPSSLVKTGCADQNITSDQTEQTYSCSATSAGGSAGPVSVSIKRDATAPTNVSGAPDRVPDHNGWYNLPVGVSFTGEDATSGIASCSAATYNGPDDASAAVYGDCTDNAGNTSGTVASTAFKYDATAPVIDATLSPPNPASTGWYNAATGAPTVSFSCSDATSGIAGACPSDYTFAEGANQGHSATVYDNAGNSASAGVSGISVDLTPPVIADQGPTASANGSNGWYISAVTNQFDASDATSGLADPNQASFTVSSGSAEGAAVKINSGPVSDVAGNTAPGLDSAAFKIDLSDPANVAFVGGPAAGGSYYFGFVPPAPTCTAEDAVSGLASCAVSGYSAGVGAHTMTATATDVAGRTATATRAYTVLAWTLKGFYSPVDMNGVVNTVKNGSTVPLKFEVFAGATELTDTSIVSTLVKQVTCNAGPEDTVEVVATGGTVLRYDWTAGQFVFNWQTPKLAGKCYDVTLTTQDGSTITAKFKLK